MKLVKGMMIGSLLTTGMFLMWNETNNQGINKTIKKGQQIIKKMLKKC